MQKRPQPKVAATSLKAEQAQRKTKPATSRSRSAVLLRAVETQQAAHELLDQLGAARSSQLLRQNMTASDLQLTQRVFKLLAQLRTGSVANQKIKRTITAEHWARYEANMNAPTASEVLMQDGLPDQLRYYGESVAKADKLNALADAAARRNSIKSSAAAKKLRYKAEAIYEAAAFDLQNQLESTDGETEMRIRAWLDRDFEYSTSGTISPDCVGIARIRGSVSQYCLDRDENSKAAKTEWQQEIKMQAVIEQLQGLIYKEELAAVGKTVFDREKFKRFDFAALNPEKD